MNEMSVIIMKCPRAGKSQSDRLSHIDHTLLTQGSKLGGA